MFLLGELLQVLPQWSASFEPTIKVGGITDRVNEVRRDDVFVAIEGTNFDGHTVVAEAVDRGATVVIVQHDVPEVNACVVRVPDSRLALALLLKETMVGVKQAIASLTWIGVTGTNGKTTVATLTEQLLNGAGKHTAFVGTVYIGHRAPGGQMKVMDTTYTTPHARQLYELALLFASNGVTHVVMEVSSHGLHQHRVAGIPFAAAAFTNLTRDHLDYHGSMEEYALAKQLLFTGLGEQACAVVNASSDRAMWMLERCSAHRKLMASVADLSAQASGTSFTAIYEQQERPTLWWKVDLTTPLIGEFNATNTVLACGLAHACGVDESTIVALTKHLQPPKGRMEQFHLSSGAVAIVDFAHTPDGLEQALLAVRKLTGHLTVVFGCGGNRDHGKRPNMAKVAEQYADEIWITSDNPRNEDPATIIAEIVSGLTEPDSVHVDVDRARAIRGALTGASAGSIVIIAGKGHEQSQEIAGVKHHFSDQEIVREYV